MKGCRFNYVCILLNKTNMGNSSKSYLPQFLKCSMNILLLAGFVVFIWSAINSFSGAMNTLSFNTIVTFILFVVGGISLLAILFYLRKIVDSLITRTPFIWSNVNSLRRISASCFIITFCYILNIFINNQYKGLRIVTIDNKGVHTDIEFLIFFFAGCFIFILSEVFKQAVEYKEENDLTV